MVVESIMEDEREIRRRRRRISIVDLPDIALVNILLRLSPHDIFMNCFLVCKYFNSLITELIQQNPRYLTTLYRDNLPATYFLVYESVERHPHYVYSYIGELHSTEEVERVLKKYIDVYDYKIAWERVLKKYIDVYDYKIAWERVLKKYGHDEYDYKINPTCFTLDRLKCPFDKLIMTNTYGIGEGRGIILSCNGIICAKLHNSIIVTNPVFHDVMLLDYPRCQISSLGGDKSVQKIYSSGMGFGCTWRNCNKFKVLLVESCVCTRDPCCTRSVTIRIDEERCVKATAKIRTIGTDNDWRVLPEEDCWFLCCHTYTFVTFHGTFFWIGHCLLEFTSSTSQCVCVAFDVEEEKARAIELPPEFRQIDFYHGGLVVLGDDLCLYDNVTYYDHLIIWKMMKDTMTTTTTKGALNNFWTKELVIKMAGIQGGFVPISKLPTGEILMLIQKNGKSFIYNPKTQYIGCSYASGVHSIPYIPNFASLNDVIKKGIDDDISS